MIENLKVALITGASGGIGEAFARQLAAQGKDLILVARNGPKLAALAEDLGGVVPMQPVELNDVESRVYDLVVNSTSLGLAPDDPLPVDPRAIESSALLDADRLVVSGGAGVEFWDPFALVDGPVSFDAFLQWHALMPSSLPRATAEPRSG